MTQLAPELENKAEEQRFSQSMREVANDVKNLDKLSFKLQVAPSEDKEILKDLRQALQEKIVLILNHIDEKKIGKAQLAQLTKSLRILSDRLTKSTTGVDKVVETRNINLNIDVSKLSKEELLQLLNERTNRNN